MVGVVLLSRLWKFKALIIAVIATTCLILPAIDAGAVSKEYYYFTLLSHEEGENGGAVTKELEMHGQVVSATACDQISPVIISCYIAEGDSMNISVEATITPAETVTVYAGTLPPNSTFPTKSGPGSVQSMFTFTPQPDQVGQVYEAVFISSDAGGTLKTEIQAHITVTAAPRYPEIQVIPDGIDFGKVQIGKDSPALVTVTNTGDETLTATCSTEADSSFGIEEGQPLTLQLPPGASTELSVFFKPVTGGQHNGMLLLSTNDPQRQYITIPLTGTATEPEPQIYVDPESVDFGLVGIETTGEAVFVVGNTGQGPLKVEPIKIKGGSGSKFELRMIDISQEKAIDPEYESFTLEAGNAVECKVRFYTDVEGVFTDELIIISNDKDNPQVIVLLKATCKKPPAPPTALEITNNPVVVAAIDEAWKDSQVASYENRHEEGGWIIQNILTGELKVHRAQPIPDRSSISIHNYIPWEDNWRIVGSFHTHPNPTKDEKGMTWNVYNPGQSDLNNPATSHIPCIIKHDKGFTTYGVVNGGVYNP